MALPVQSWRSLTASPHASLSAANEAEGRSAPPFSVASRTDWRHTPDDLSSSPRRPRSNSGDSMA